MRGHDEELAQPAAGQGDAGEAPVERGHAVPQQEEVPAVGQDVEDSGPLTCALCGDGIRAGEGVWVNARGEAGCPNGVDWHIPFAHEPDGLTIWLVRSPDNDKLYLDHDGNWSNLPMAAVFVDWEKAIIEPGEHAKDYIWVAFCEAPF